VQPRKEEKSMTAPHHDDTFRTADHVSDRRSFIKAAAAAGLGATLLGGKQARAQNRPSIGPAPAGLFKTDPMDRVKIAFVGVGGMGSAHVRNFLKIDKVDIVAVCDIVEEKAKRIAKWCTDDGRPAPTLYTRGDHDFKRLCETEDVDIVYTATPWRWHVPVCVAAMVNGKHAATEVPAAVHTEGCWQLVETAEKYKKHCVMMENCCYDRVELMILNMVRKGLFGELLHGEGAYNHDLRGVKFAVPGEGEWRREHSKKRDANLYPTHGLGPVAQCMNINRGDQFDYLVSMSTNSRGLQEYARKRFGEDDPRHHEQYLLGDVNICLIKTKLGRTITVIHDTNLPRPYSRAIMMQGTKGVARKYPEALIHIEGRTEGHGWEKLEDYRAEFEHPLFTNLQKKSAGAGHGGMDYIEDYRLIQSLLRGEPMDMDVYDAAAWSVITDATETSNGARSKTVDIPDFTRGQWKHRPPLGIVED
jgi:predicted dehydrogenase